MLTDYHVHLRPDDPSTAAANYFTAGQRRALPRDRRADAASPELGVSEHVHRFTAALDVWQHPFWRQSAVDDLDRYVEFVREETDLRLGHRGRLHPRPRGPDGQPARAPRLGLRRRLGALPRRSRRRLRRRDRHLAPRDDAPSASGSATSRRSPSPRCSGLSTSSPTRTWSRSGAPRGPLPGEGPALLLRARVEAMLEARRGDGGLHRRAAQAGRRDLPGAGVARDGGRRGHPIALSSDAHVPEHLGVPLRGRASKLLDELRRDASSRVFERRERRMEPLG